MINNTIILIICNSGQTLKNAGVWLRSDVFTHGQLYVACSRVGNPDGLKFAVKRSNGTDVQTVQNVVYREVLLNK